jgi:alpha-L-rhamnosidase
VCLRCEGWAAPLGLDVPAPRLSWKLPPASRRGLAQTAYRLLVASSPGALAGARGDLWDTGDVASDRSLHVPYGGRPLRSGERAWWTVRIRDDRGVWSEWAEPAWWEMGLLALDDWAGAEWIGGELAGGPRTPVPPPLVRVEFDAKPAIVSARLYASALGLFEARINGRPVSDEALAPGWTNYHVRIPYRTYDVTGLVRAGRNALGAALGDGWACGFVGLGSRQTWSDRPKFLARLVLRYADGTEASVVTGPAWRHAYGPVLLADLFWGEHYDARREFRGWDEPGFDAEDWRPVRTFPEPGASSRGRPLPPREGDVRATRARVWSPAGPVRPQEERKPVAPPREFKGWPRSTWVFDFGQNLVGRCRLKVSGEAGRTIVLRHAEVLNPDGTLYTANLRSAKQEDVYTLRGGGEETWEPRFTVHGFRYVELTGLDGAPGPDTLTAVVLHSEIPPTGRFECSDELVNQLMRNVEWSQRGNFVEVPTDCPQRDERLGWTGDIQVFAPTACFLRDVEGFLRKWLRDLADAQSADGAYPSVAPDARLPGGPGQDGGPAWADAGVFVPWTHWTRYGDLRVLEDQYPSLARFLDFLDRTCPDGIRCHPDRTAWGGYGDWLSIGAETPKDLIGTAFLARSAELGARIAELLGETADTARWRALQARARDAFQARFVGADGRVASGTQTAYVLALHFRLLEDRHVPGAVEALVADIRARGTKLSCGFVGSPFLPHVLSDFGRLDVAYDLLHQTAWPSWLYAVTQGATTIWERWDGWTHDRGFQDPGMNSFNHYAYGAIGAWLVRVVAGLDLDESAPAYKRSILAPRPGGRLTSAAARLETPYGLLRSAWRIEDGEFRWDVTVPPNTTALVRVPASDPKAVTESGRPAASADGLRALPPEPGVAVFEAAPGTYAFASRLPSPAESR